MPNSSPLPEFLTEQDLADLLKVARATLRRWRWAHKGPLARKICGSVRYLRADVLAFIHAAPKVGGSE